jgi:hypothetical protein
MRKTVLLTLVLCAAASCVTWREQKQGPRALLARPERSVRVNRSTVLFNPSIAGDSLIGTVSKAREDGYVARADSTRVAFALGDIQRIDARRVSPLRTAALAGGLFVGALALAIVTDDSPLFGPGTVVFSLTR